LPDGAADAGVRSVVSGGPALVTGIQVLLAVRDGTVRKPADGQAVVIVVMAPVGWASPSPTAGETVN